jgi:hypothetical protein
LEKPQGEEMKITVGREGKLETIKNRYWNIKKYCCELD